MSKRFCVTSPNEVSLAKETVQEKPPLVAPSPFRKRLSVFAIKDLSYLDETAGGALVPPPEQKDQAPEATELERAKHSDLITLPEGVEGTNCSNCRFVTSEKYCTHPEVNQLVNERMCCKYWDAPGTQRAWLPEGGEPQEPQKQQGKKGIKGSYFGECERDDEGHCLPSGEVAAVIAAGGEVKARIVSVGTSTSFVPPSPFRKKNIYGFLIKAEGQPCVQGETSAQTGCTPASGEADTSAPKEGEEKPASTLGQLGSMTWDSLKKAGHSIKHVEHAIKEWTEGKIEQQLALLPPILQKYVRGVWVGVRFGTKAAFATYTAGQKAAELVAQERGATPEEAQRLKAILSTIDIATFKPVSVFVGAAATPAAAGVASFIPIGSMTYLAYSTARDPLATVRVARKAIGSITKRVTGDKAMKSDNRELLNKVYQWLESGEQADYRMALLLAALDETQDLRKAFEIAQQAGKSAGQGQKGIKGSYFEECERDEEGRCLPSGEAGQKKPEKEKKPKVIKAELDRLAKEEIQQKVTKFKEAHPEAETNPVFRSLYFGFVAFSDRINAILRFGLDGALQRAQDPKQGFGNPKSEQQFIRQAAEKLPQLLEEFKTTPLRSGGEEVYRVVPDHLVQGLAEGEVIEDQGIMSTSLSLAHVQNEASAFGGKTPVILRIQSATGTPIIWQEKEAEVVFPPGARLRIDRIEDHEYFVTMLPRQEVESKRVSPSVPPSPFRKRLKDS